MAQNSVLPVAAHLHQSMSAVEYKERAQEAERCVFLEAASAFARSVLFRSFAEIVNAAACADASSMS
jgi:hypothetical protein